MAVDFDTVVKQLTDSRIIAPGKLDNFVPPKASPKSVDQLVAELVQNNHLTQFQAARVKAGRAKSLMLGEYLILDKIGAGGMGQVFKAHHRRMKRLVAIKILPPAMTKDARALARFEREVEAAAKLRHPNVVAADDAGHANGVHFLVMEYVDGKDLSATVKQGGPLPVNKAVNYLLQAARGLQYAHKKGVVHRDIKPANLLLDAEGTVKILDMGLARLDQSEDGAELTGSGTIMGTIDYMSPEQALNTKHADARADIYSLGVSLYYLLSGKAPFAGDTVMEKLLAHRDAPIPSLLDTQTTITKQLDAVFQRMVAKRPEDRYQSMNEVVEALEGLGYDGPITKVKSELASTIHLATGDRKKLAPKGNKTALKSLTQAVANEKSKNLLAKIVGAAFVTIIAPILVTFLVKYLEKEDKPAAVPAQAAFEPAHTPPSPDLAERAVSGSELAITSNHREAADGAPPLAVAPFDFQQAKAHQQAWAKHLGTQIETTNSVGLTMVLIPAGEFMMGSTPEQNALGRKIIEDAKVPAKDSLWAVIDEEMPQHLVRLTRPFVLGRTEVTVGQFTEFSEATSYVTEIERAGSAGKQGRTWRQSDFEPEEQSPVAYIDWNDACAFCNWLSEQERLAPCYRRDGTSGWELTTSKSNGYRLPTEAEWEYACRAGTTTQFSFGDDVSQLTRYAWYGENARGSARHVGLKLPNPFGLYDMHGNVRELCDDRYDGVWYANSPKEDPLASLSDVALNNRPVVGHVARGGLYSYYAAFCRSATRNNYTPGNRMFACGFRVARTLFRLSRK